MNITNEYLNKLNARDKVRAENYLSQLIRDSRGNVTTRAEWCLNKIARGYKLVTEFESPIKFNRVKYNRMLPQEQKAYDARLNEKVEVVYLSNGDTMHKLTKIEHDFCLFNS